ncbi:MAG: hypothetical protein IJ752_04640 [Alphaproteobacteria bacterium]|nr:hypothetical protein [Alphaproteobacteria bacterium]
MQYTKPLNETNLNARYKDAVPAQGIKGSTVPALAIEAPQREIVNLITSAGLPPSAEDNTQLTQAVERKIKTFVQEIVPIEATSGTVALAANTIYQMTISAATTFSLPSEVDASVHNQIKILLNLATVAAVNVGTDRYFNCEAPDMSSADYYDLYFDFDPNQGVWVAGALKKGIAS